ncbi:MAG: multidrug efflux SMR transporter [Helicobacter sp.]|nr:multidrug efflux SMR transporter [Helicobacter sp.]
MGWLFIIVGGIAEILWVSGLKYSQSLEFYILTIAGIIFSFFCMILATKKIEVSVAYAVFVGIGAGGVVLSEIIFFHKPLVMSEMILIGLLFVGVIGLKLTSKDDEKKDKEAIEQISEALGIDELNDEMGNQIKAKK